MKNRSLWMSAAATFVAAAALAGCGSTTYFAGRSLPPSGLTNRVLIAIQNPSTLSKGALQIVDAYYDIRNSYNDQIPSFSISGYSGSEPISIQNMPEEQYGAVYNSGDNTFVKINYATETATGSVSGLNGASASVFITRNQEYVFAASEVDQVLSVVDYTNGGSYPLSLPGVYRVSVNPGGSVAFAFTKNTNYVYYPRKLTTSESTLYAGGSANWPKAAVDCEPQTAPGWCLFQMQSPDTLDAKTNTYYGAPLVLNRPYKAVFSSDGGTAYILSCGPECGAATAPTTGFPATAAVTPISVAPIIYLVGQASGILPTQSTINSNTIAIPGGATNALVDSSTLYLVGQEKMGDGYWGGHLTTVNLSTNAITSTIPISDGTPGGPSRMIEADDNTLWIGMTDCTNGERYNNPTIYTSGYGCLTMVNISTPTSPTVTMLEPYIGDATGIAAVTSLHKIYTAEDGQVYIFSTTDGAAIDNQYVTVTGTAMDVAYMDGTTDSNNTVY